MPPTQTTTMPPPTRVQNYISQWIVIPHWLAGEWQGDEETILYSFNHKTQSYLPGCPQVIKLNRVSKIGTQKDSTGVIWHAGAPYTKLIDTPAYNEYHTIEDVVQLDSSESTAIMISLDHVSKYSKLDSQRLDEFKEATTTTYIRMNDDQILVKYDISDFGLDNSRRYTSQAYCIQHRVCPFRRLDFDSRGNLKLMFRRFLMENGQERLIPREP